MNAPLNFFISQRHKILVSLFSMLSLAIGTDIASAQVPEDQRVTEDPRFSTQVTFTPDDGIHKIEGGTTPDNNNSLLFHSFDSFSLNDGQTARFDHGTNIATILSRVTGGTFSQINGVIEAGDADIFIINPQGITFGPNATLKIGGSFIASTAERIVFAEGVEFSASNPQPVDSLLTVSQPIGLSLEGFSADIVNESTAFNSDLGSSVGLEVSPRESIMLIGNGIVLSGGVITSSSGRIELASLDEESSVNLILLSSDSRSAWSLEYADEGDTLGNVRLSSGAFINTNGYSVSDGPNSHIRLRGHHIVMEDSSIFASSAGKGQGGDITLSADGQLVLTSSGIYAYNYEEAQGGDITLSAGEDIILSASDRPAPTGSFILASVFGQENGRNLNIDAANLNLQGASFISTSTYSQGNGGALTIDVLGTVELGGGSSILAQVGEPRDEEATGDETVTGNAGKLTLNAASLSLQDTSFISTSTYSQGNGGALTIDVLGTVELGGGSSILARVGEPREEATGDETVTGNAGKLTLNAASLSLRDASFISTSTYSQGNGGDLTIDVSGGTVELLGNSRLLAQSNRNASGTAGNLTIDATDLSVEEGSIVSTTALGNSQAGKLVIDTSSSIRIGGIHRDEEDGSITQSVLSATTEGNQDAEGIQIYTGTLLVEDGGQIQAGTFGSGNGGAVEINASESVIVTGQSSGSDSTPSQISSTTAASAGNAGNAGLVRVETGRLEVSDGATIFTTSNSAGQGGDLTVEADEVVLSGRGSGDRRSGLYARAIDTGNSGTVNLTANTLRIENGARLTVSNRDINESLPENLSAQDFGTVQSASITAQSITLDNGEITAESRSGRGGDLNFNVQDFILLRNNSLISATAGTDQSGGDGGNVNINIPDGFIIAVPNENSDIIANAFSGTGGNIDITSQDIIGLDTRTDTRTDARDNTTNDIEASSRFGRSGTITLNNLGLDPAAGLVELPANTAAPDQVAQRCLADSAGRSAFVVTGQGGTAPNPGDVVRNEAAGWVDLGRAAPPVSRSPARLI
ncbi:MAG: filamentous hemagglutinin N-terminal domain-containing protein, partial [Phormidesmis sp.]